MIAMKSNDKVGDKYPSPGNFKFSVTIYFKFRNLIYLITQYTKMKAHQSLILVALALVGPVLSTLPHPLSEDAFHQLVQQHGADIGLRMLEDRMLELEDADLTAVTI